MGLVLEQVRKIVAIEEPGGNRNLNIKINAQQSKEQNILN